MLLDYFQRLNYRGSNFGPRKTSECCKQRYLINNPASISASPLQRQFGDARRQDDPESLHLRSRSPHARLAGGPAAAQQRRVALFPRRPRHGRRVLRCARGRLRPDRSLRAVRAGESNFLHYVFIIESVYVLMSLKLEMVVKPPKEQGMQRVFVNVGHRECKN